jgi:hypothetical protein
MKSPMMKQTFTPSAVIGSERVGKQTFVSTSGTTIPTPAQLLPEPKNDMDKRQEPNVPIRTR